MIKKLCSIILALIMLLTYIPTTFAADAVAAKAEAAYGTPVIDGEIDKSWNNTNYNLINLVKSTDTDTFYKGWFKLLWDEANMYVLAKVYSEYFVDNNDNPWDNDSFEVFIDEKNNKSTKYEEDDYQLRSDFKGATSGLNYDFENLNVASAVNEDEGYYIVEMAFPTKTVKLADGLTMGFDIQVNSAQTLLFPKTLYGWNETSRRGSVSSNTSMFGNVELKKSVTVREFAEPEVVSAIDGITFNLLSEKTSTQYVGTVNASFDGTSYSDIKVAYSNEYPCVEINDLAKLIGGTVTGGNTLKKNKVTLTYFVGDRIAKYTHADYPNNPDYLTTYYENTADIIKNTVVNKLATISEKPIPGETEIKKLPEGYVNDGTDGENDGYMMETVPVMVNGGLYVPLSSLIPTLNYYIEYNRFATPKTITITSGTNYPAESSFKTFYVKDYNAVGDGITDDKEAVLAAFYAALSHNGPAKLEFEKGKTYRVSAENSRNPFFHIDRRENFIIEGNGSTIQFMHPLNSFLAITSSSKNVQVRNLAAIYEEHMSSHGIIDEVNKAEGWFTMSIPEAFVLPPPTAFVKALGSGYGFGYVFDPQEKHIKFLPVDNFQIDGVEHMGGRQIKINVKSSSAGYLGYVEPGDGFLMGTTSNMFTYGITTSTKGGNGAGITIQSCSDILIDGVTLTGSPVLGCSVGLNDGTITFRNYKMKIKDGAINASNSDGLHYWRNRATLLVEDSEMWNNLDDHINTKGELGNVTKVNGRTITTDYDQKFKQGDEVLIYKRDGTNDELLLRAYVEAVSGLNLTLDRDVPDSVIENSGKTSGTRSVIFNQMACGAGTCIRGSRFLNSRRHGYISRAKNTIYMNNYMQNNGGTMVSAENESNSSEGPFPSAFTLRNCRAYSDGITANSHVKAPITFRNQGLSTSIPPQIDGALIEGNIIQVNTKTNSILINSVKDLYMRNNTIKWSPKWDDGFDAEAYKKYVPVQITNSEIKEIDGIHFEYDIAVDSIISIAVTNLNKENASEKIKNVTKPEGNESKDYTIIK